MLQPCNLNLLGVKMYRFIICCQLGLVALLPAYNLANASVSMHGYWRLGLNTTGDLTIPAVQQQNLQEQGEHKLFYDIPTSRHVSNPSYFWLQAVKTLDNDVKAVVKVDHSGQTAHYNNNWPNPENPETLSAQAFTVRDLYIEMPMGEDSSIWAGTRYYEFEDIRLFDVLNFFNHNAHGIGYHRGGSLASLSFSLSDFVVDEEEPRKRQETTLLLRHEMPLAGNYSLKPMAHISVLGSLAKDHQTEAPSIKATQVYRLGGVLTRWGDNFWGNTHFWSESTPTDPTGMENGRNLVIGLGESASYDFGTFGVLFAAWLQQERFHAEQDVYEVKDNELALKEDKTTKSVFKTSIGIQPVYYLTDAWHVAVDINVTNRSQKTGPNQFNSTLITPILRYSAERSTLGVPQIYTSLTWGSYDWKAKQDVNGKPTDTLVTTQTGFEIWF